MRATGTFAALGALVVRHRWGTLAITLAVAALAGIIGVGGLDRFGHGGELQRDAESARAADAIREHLGDGGADVLVTYRSPVLSVTEPAFRAAVDRSLAAAPAGLVTGTLRSWADGLPTLNAVDGRATVVAVMLAGADDTERTNSYRMLRAQLRSEGLAVSFSGPVPIRDALVTEAQDTLLRLELLALPAVFALLVLLFRSLVAALLPVLVGALTLAVAFALLRPLAGVMDISVLAVNALTVLCLALAVDSALFVVARFREELARRDDVDQAVVATVASAGRTCLFSGLTIGVTALSLVLFPTGLTRSIGLCTAIAMGVGTVLSLTALPASLAVLGRRVDLLRVPAPRWLRPGSAHRFWGRVGRAVIAEPVAYLVATVVLLVLLTLPFLHVTLGFPDQRSLPAGDPARVATEEQRADFAFPALDLVQVVTEFGDPAGTPARAAATRDWTGRLLGTPGARWVVTAEESGHHAVFYVYAGAAESPATLDLVRDIRALPPPPGGSVLVGGASAMAVDVLDALSRWLPWVLACIAVAAFASFALMLRSVVLPLKALVVTALPLGASFGVLTWIFQDGNLTWLVGAAPTGYLDVFQPFLLLVILVGLSLDYEFFLLARIREEYDRTGETDTAIVNGLRLSAPVFTGAALVVLVVAAVIATSEVMFVKQLCVGIFVAVAVDATVVRAVLVPASVRLLGAANWWWPGRARGQGETERTVTTPAASSTATR
ncbi:MMPL family transporter [Actinophytocola gossypii]|uniref:MMPL family transporter n=1 Tax=Actinophytocola gossypii TaxID=2812003 RepID=A0ABT2J1W9_9PSEU|nr:MMPL family transporter [Actinophytocola gossypii]MCT2581761.1 MMPL family transporter [Actinophytocola gossypii]